jgi:hypothetical protein
MGHILLLGNSRLSLQKISHKATKAQNEPRMDAKTKKLTQRRKVKAEPESIHRRSQRSGEKTFHLSSFTFRLPNPYLRLSAFHLRFVLSSLCVFVALCEILFAFIRVHSRSVLCLCVRFYWRLLHVHRWSIDPAAYFPTIV